MAISRTGTSVFVCMKLLSRTLFSLEAMLHETPKNTLKTTETSLDIIETIERRRGATMTEISDDLSLAVSTVYKHLSTLESRGYLNKKDGTYYIGFRFLNLGEHARNRLPGRELIEESIQQLTAETNEEVDFVVEDHGQIITITESYHKWVKRTEESNEYRARTGSYYYMHSTASGKAILASYPRERVEAIIDKWGLPAQTEQTITDKEELFAELDQTREREYAIDDEEFTDGLRSVGMTVSGSTGGVVGAISVSGPSYHLTSDVLRTTIPTTLGKAIEELEQDLAAIDLR